MTPQAYDDWDKLWNVSWIYTESKESMIPPDHKNMESEIGDVYFVLNTTNLTTPGFSEPYTLDVIVPLTVIYSVIFVTGILGNFSTCVVISRNRSMHTATNFYLFSLAISDLILLVCGLPLELYRLWDPYIYPLGEAMCITVGLASETSANATVLTIAAFTVERYIAICRPFMSHTMSKLSRAVRFIVAIWVCALCTAVPQAMQFGIRYDEDNGQKTSACTVIGQGVHQVFIISSFVFFVVPMSLISVLYALIGMKLRTSRVLHPVKKLSLDSHERGAAGAPTLYRNGTSQRRVIRMLGEYLEQEHPNKQQYYRTMSIAGGLLGLNNHYWDGFPMPPSRLFRIQRLIVIYFVPIATVSQVVYLVQNGSKHNFVSLSMMFAILPVSIIVMVKVALAQTSIYRVAMEDFTTKVHIYSYYKNNNIPYVRQTLIETEKLVRVSMLYTFSFCYTCWSGFEIVPIIHNFQNNESFDNITSRLEIVCHIWLPFDYEFNFRNWIIVQIIMVYCGFIAISVVAIFDQGNFTFLYHLIGQIKIFKNRVETIFNDDMNDEEVRRCMIHISQHYKFLMETLDSVQTAFGFNVACIYMHNLFAGGLFIYQLSRSGADLETILTYGLSIPLYMGVLVIISFALEYIRTVGDDIPDLIYGLKWENMSLSNQKMVLNVLCQVQPVLEFKAAFNIRTGMETAIAIIKTTFSFYVMMKQ